MGIREAHINDVSQIQVVRNSVKENRLSKPSLVSDEDCINYLTARGKGWVAEAGKGIIGFSIVDMQDKNVWALFVHPGFEGMGIGKKLHDILLKWYFSQAQETIWLGTAPGTRAELFYRKAGWVEVGQHGKGEIKFEMRYEDWRKINPNNQG